MATTTTTLHGLRGADDTERHGHHQHHHQQQQQQNGNGTAESIDDGKPGQTHTAASHLEEALAGHEATDEYGHPLADIDPAHESRIRLKMDFAVVPLVSLIYLLSFIDRSNIGNAKLAGLERDLGMHGYDYNTALSVFYITYIVFEIPCNAACKWLGPGWFLPAVTLAFGVTTVATAFVRSFEALCGIRCLLGVFEAGMMPGIAYYLSRWYRRSELTFRVSLFILSAALAGAFGGLLASAILKLPSFGSVHSWRMIFAIEGIATIALALASFVLLTDRPETAIWLSDADKALAVARLKAERIGTTELVDGFSWAKLRHGILNPVVLPTSAIFLLNSITVHGASFFLPSIVSSIYPDRSVTQQQLLTVPPYAVGAFGCVALSYASWRLERRGIFMICCAPLAVVGYALFLAPGTGATVRYGAIFLPFFGMFAYGALTNAHVAANVVSDTARASAIATNVMFGNIGGLASTWAYIQADAPRYNIGNGLNLAAQSSMFLIAIGLYFWIRRDNKKRAARDVRAGLEGKSVQEIQDMDWHHPGFRWHN